MRKKVLEDDEFEVGLQGPFFPFGSFRSRPFLLVVSATDVLTCGFNALHINERVPMHQVMTRKSLIILAIPTTGCDDMRLKSSFCSR